MPKHILLFAILFTTTLNCFAGIANVGNGGDVVECSLPRRSLIYTLDYLVADERVGRDKEIVEDKTLQASIDRIERIITLNAPYLKDSFTHFFSLVKNQNPLESHIWIDNDHLPDIDDERLNHFKGSICSMAFARANVKQAVVRQVITRPDQERQVIFNYDRQIYTSLQYENPTQLSFLLVHEWLWDLNDNVAENRNINYFLHSKNIQNMQPADVIQKLKQLGLKTNK